VVVVSQVNSNLVKAGPNLLLSGLIEEKLRCRAFLMHHHDPATKGGRRSYTKKRGEETSKEKITGKLWGAQNSRKIQPREKQAAQNTNR